MITLSQESEYAYGLEFKDIPTLREEVGGLCPSRDLTRYEGDTPRQYVARILDLPLSVVRVCDTVHNRARLSEDLCRKLHHQFD